MKFLSKFGDKFVSSGVFNKGFFRLSSGLLSEYYMQCAKIFEDPSLSEEVCIELKNKIEQQFGKNAFNIVVSPAMGGVIFGYEMSRALGIKNVFFERKDLNFELRRGFEIPENSKILIAEDVITTGKSSMEIYNLLSPYKPQFVAEVCIFDRTGGKFKPSFKITSLEQMTIETFDENSIPQHLQGKTPIKPGSRK
jgi:orotate phosphoribosyltransferase